MVMLSVVVCLLLLLLMVGGAWQCRNNVVMLWSFVANVDCCVAVVVPLRVSLMLSQ